VKPVGVQRLAESDIFDAIHYYVQHAPHVASRFVRSIDAAIELIGRSPNLGSAAFAEALDIEGLRFRVVRSFPYALFYLELESEVSVIRFLHHGRDVMSLIGAADE
jgi:plasmid stabilization system protein ParE